MTEVCDNQESVPNLSCIVLFSIAFKANPPLSFVTCKKYSEAAICCVRKFLVATYRKFSVHIVIFNCTFILSILLCLLKWQHLTYAILCEPDMLVSQHIRSELC